MVLDDNTIEISSFSSQVNMCYSFKLSEQVCGALIVVKIGNYTLSILTNDNRKSNKIEMTVLGEKIEYDI